MQSVYLEPSDYVTYGLPTTTSASQITLASTIIDGYLYRPEGLIWSPDANGDPCYMSALTPSITLTSVGSIPIGKNVNVTVTGGIRAVQQGFVAILDRSNPLLTEAVIVNSITGNVVQLYNTQFEHDAGCLLEFGMCIFEEKQMPSDRPLTSLDKFPVQNILGGQGRYGYPRRSDSGYSNVNQYNLLAVMTKFGGPPIWEIFDYTKCGIDPLTAEIWIPAGIMLAYYTEVRLSYIAGYTYISLPPQIKQACANIAKNSVNFPVNGSIKSYRAGDTEIQAFAATYIDNDTQQMLYPFQARLFG